MTAKRAVLVAVLMGAMLSAQAAPGLGEVRASAIERAGERLVVGLRDGGVALYDATFSTNLLYRAGAGTQPTQAVTFHAGKLFWSVRGATLLHSLDPLTFESKSVDLKGTLVGPIERITPWDGGIVVHSRTRACFVRASDTQPRLLDEVFPLEIAEVLAQGMVLSTWEAERGTVVSIRQIGERQGAAGAEDIAQVTAWSKRAGEFKRLGAYAASLIDFEPAQGPPVRYRQGQSETERPFAVGAVDHLRLIPEGLVALEADGLLRIAFSLDSWLPERFETTVAPGLERSASADRFGVWWTDGRRVLHASAEDGETTAYLPRQSSSGALVQVLADEAGAFVMREKGIDRILFSALESTGYVRANPGENVQNPEFEGQHRLAAAIRAAREGRNLGQGPSAIAALYRQAGLPDPRQAGRLTFDLRYGDAILDGGRLSIYVGSEQALTIEGGAISSAEVQLSPTARVLRVIDDTPFVAQPAARPNPMLVALNRPNGSGLPVVTFDASSRFDRPYLASHERLLAIAESWVGTPYRWGGNDRNGVDCSGFVKAVYAELGVNLPRHSQDMGKVSFGQVVTDQLHFGDVLVFPDPKHVAIYVGGGRTIETVSGGVGYSTVGRRTVAVVRRFLTR